MPTKKQAAANKRNAKKSTGSRTAEGKAKSAHNATKLGVLTRPVTAPHKDLEEFLHLQPAFMEEFRPETYVAQLLVKRLAMLFWREHRLADAALLSVGYDTLCRSSELSWMRVEDVRLGETRIYIPRSKSDPFGDGRFATVSTATTAIVDRERYQQWATFSWVTYRQSGTDSP